MRPSLTIIGSHPQRGAALLVGLILLIALSLVAIVVMHGTLLNMHLTSNVSRHQEAFRASDSFRSVPEAFLDQNLYNAGWPVSWGGSVPDVDFDFSTINPAIVTNFKNAITLNGTVAPPLLYGALPAGEKAYDPSTWSTAMTFTLTNPNNDGTDIKTNISIIGDGVVASLGTGAAQASGYRGLGVGAGSGGIARYFEVQGISLSPSDGHGGRANTITQYRSIIR